MIERCHFLFNELRPAIGNEINAVTRSKLLRSVPRWKDAISRVVQNNRKQKCKLLELHVFYIKLNYNFFHGTKM